MQGKIKSKIDNRVLLVSVFLKTEGGVTRFARDLISSAYLQVFDAGLKRAFWGMMVTAIHILKFPFVLILRDPKIIHINGLSWGPFW